MISEQSVTVTTVVRTGTMEAFRIFTEEIDGWWRRGPAYRAHEGAMRFDDGRLLEGAETIGRVVAWEPGVRLELEWNAWGFRAGEVTTVEIRFEAIGDGTRVTVEHRGWQSRGAAGGAFQAVVGLWWGTMLPAVVRLAGGRG